VRGFEFAIELAVALLLAVTIGAAASLLRLELAIR